ncbi:cell division protein ZapA [Brumimicrobium glaciale]|jgi:cell division protein ZapA|uniref:Cell division protein ZapA n=1 Tax=Brumimicrobium glaciale TaxID=200475 RepID=A0A4Q4KM77_9FLAO|nr:cell division protein ZapA [Brumimicrobium glaciale]RYM32989.1 cell division protein ZapA [Brumimicrobium glaciale]
MSKVSIKIVIAGRNYPLTINEGEEELVRKAVEDINTNVQKLQESYAVKDMQDLLAMTSLQLATRANTAPSDGKERVLKTEMLDALKVLSQNIEVE